MALEAGDAAYNDLVRCATEGRLKAGDRVLHNTGTAVDEGGTGVRCGAVVRVEEGGQLRVKYDTLDLDHGKYKSTEVLVDKDDNLSLAPPETDLKARDLVRVVFDGQCITGQKWQYGLVRYVHHKLLLDINLDGGEVARGLPAYAHEIQKVEREL